LPTASADDLGRRPGYLDHNAYTDSRASIEELLRSLRPTRVIEREVPAIEIDF
jgi:hypothetical protein